jgi:hypothetical protein
MLDCIHVFHSSVHSVGRNSIASTPFLALEIQPGHWILAVDFELRSPTRARRDEAKPRPPILAVEFFSTLVEFERKKRMFRPRVAH